MRWSLCVVVVCVLAAASCSSGTAPTSTSGADPESTAATGEPVFRATLDQAIAVNVASNGGSAVVAWITHEDVMTGTVDLVAGEVTDRAEVNGGVAPVGHPIERPALRVGADETVDVAFTSFSGDGASVFLARDGGDPVQVSGPPRPETNLVHMTTSPEEAPLLAWLEDATLSIGRDVGDEFVEEEAVDDTTCDCCNPVPVFVDQSLVVAYRDFDLIDEEIVRNVVAVRSEDGGREFEAPVIVADEDWFISGCPFTGPDVAVVDGTVIVAWMDARQSVHPDQADSSIWVDRSTDGGATFGVDLAVTSGDLHKWPALAVDGSGLIHLVWETLGAEGGLSYAWSDDQGVSFSDPVLLVDREATHGAAPASPSAVFHDGLLIVTWADGRDGQVAAWELGG